MSNCRHCIQNEILFKDKDNTCTEHIAISTN